MRPGAASVCLLTVACCAAPAGVSAQSAASGLAGERIHITRTTKPITVDGDLSDEGWRNATRVEKWYETNPGDNTEPKVGNVGYLTYDDHFFYAGFEFDDPDPSAIRAPYGDRDNVPSFTDYGGIIIDTRGDGQRAQMMLANPRGIQYDAISDDASGEDASPDFFWDAAGRITDRGWTLEIRVPFSSLRYRNVDPQTWGILLYRNLPREFRFQMFSAKLPRGGNCFVCRSNILTGLEHLPSGGHVVAAPFVTATRDAHPEGELGSRLVADRIDPEIGLDLKWLPNADNAIDFTLNPDFSQVEADTAQISANERFALLFPEKRPFFLEGVDLFKTPLQAVYTRTITSPRWGGRATGKELGVRYTVLVADDDGGGSVILPGPTESSQADQEFASQVLVARAKRDIGLSFVSLLVANRENHDGSGHNRVVGPDVQWRPAASDSIVGQWLYSHSVTPVRPDLADEWNGQTLRGHAAMAQWAHSTTHLDWTGTYRDIGSRFRADTGFIPQVGYRQSSADGGWTFRPTNFLSRLRTFLTLDRQTDRDGALISRQVMPGLAMDARMNGFMQYRYIDERIRTGAIVLPRHLFGYIAQFSPSRAISAISVDGTAGRDIDFANSRPAGGATINLNATLHPTDHLELAIIRNQRWLNVDTTRGSTRLLTAHISRIKGTYTFTSRFFVRSIVQYVSTDRDPALFTTTVADRSGDYGSSLLLAYKVNWQSVMFVGFGDNRELTDQHRLAERDRQFFVKLSYAFQR
jgi:hypothetical protein